MPILDVHKTSGICLNGNYIKGRPRGLLNQKKEILNLGKEKSRKLSLSPLFLGKT